MENKEKLYNFPDYFQWPFFFTIQRKADTRIKQLQMWCDLIVDYFKEKRTWRISKSVFIKLLGSNQLINRKLNAEAADIIFDFCVDKNFGLYTSKDKNEIFILWKSIKEWGQNLYDHSIKHKKMDSLETLEYIRSDDDNKKEDFYGIDNDLLVLILKDLEKNNRCDVKIS